MTTFPSTYDEAIQLLTKGGYSVSIHTIIKFIAGGSNCDSEISCVSVYCSPLLIGEKEDEIKELLGDKFIVYGSANRQGICAELKPTPDEAQEK
jgi:hypothetical protein